MHHCPPHWPDLKKEEKGRDNYLSSSEDFKCW